MQITVEIIASEPKFKLKSDFVSVSWQIAAVHHLLDVNCRGFVADVIVLIYKSSAFLFFFWSTVGRLVCFSGRLHQISRHLKIYEEKTETN